MTTSTVVLTVYALIWPLIVAIVMFVIGRAFFTEWKESYDRGESIV